MSEVATTRVRVQRHVNAPVERVFDAWLDPNVAGLWLFTSPSSEAHDVEIDPRVGGRWQITDTREGVVYRALGEYLEIDRPRRIVFTFGMPQFSDEAAKVTVEIASEGVGSMLVVTHERLPWASKNATTQGWTAMLDRLCQELIGTGSAR